MSRILPLIEDDSNHSLLVRWLQNETNHDVVECDGTTLSEITFDLCLIDRGAMEKYKEEFAQQKEETDPVLLPFVLLLSEQQLQQINSSEFERVNRIFSETIDDVLRMPLRKFELESTVENLLRLRRRTQQLHDMRNEVRTFKDAAHAMPNAYYMTATDGTITYVNPGFEEITGYTADEAIGKTPSILKSGRHDGEYYHKLWETIESGTVWQEEVINRRKDGELYYADQTIVPVTDDAGQITWYTAVQTDITERKSRTRQLEVLDRILRHNLSNDLNVVEGRAEVIKANTSGELTAHADTILEKSEELIETATKERKIVRLLVDNDSPVPRDLVEIVQPILAAARERYPDAIIDSSLPTESWANVSPAIDQAIEELVANAIEHNDTGQPSLRLSVVAHQESVDITVADDGPGIPETETAVLTGDKTIEPLYHGRGLGLWLINWIVHFSNGTITFEENQPRGSIVSISLNTTDSGDGHTSLGT